jgi:hypothetical protein
MARSRHNQGTITHRTRANPPWAQSRYFHCIIYILFFFKRTINRNAFINEGFYIKWYIYIYVYIYIQEFTHK